MFTSKFLPNKEYKTKHEMLKALKANKDNIMALKMATIKEADSVEYSLPSVVKGQGLEEGYIYPVINTTNFIDSHKDLHLKGIWKKSVEEQQGKVHYLVNHELKLGSVVAYPKDVEMAVDLVDWSDLGAGFNGKTEALTFKTKIFEYSNKDAANAVEEKIPMNNSIRMQYVKIEMAVNDDSKDFIEEKRVWDKYINEAVNPDQAEEDGYFFAVEEAKIYKEGSMVLEGSNSQTPIRYPEEEKGLEEIKELQEKVLDNPTKENLLHFCNQFKALQEGEAVDKTLPKIEKPQQVKSKLYKF